VSAILAAVLFANLSVAAAKIAIGVSIDAVALWADGVHSLLDASSNVVGLIGIAYARKPADREHPYGHRRFETLAGVIIGLMIVAGLVAIGSSAARAFAGASDPQPTPLAAAIVGLTVVVNMIVSRIEARRGRALKSALLKADAGHTASDALASLVVLASFAGAALGFWWADAVAALIVSVFIARTAFQVLRENLGVLLDRARLDPERVRAVAMSIDGVREAHSIRSRGLADHVHLDLCVHLDPDLPLVRAHARAKGVVRAIEETFPEVADVMIQIEPDAHD
jgi:cation diffusion facilitator family transporter